MKGATTHLHLCEEDLVRFDRPQFAGRRGRGADVKGVEGSEMYV